MNVDMELRKGRGREIYTFIYCTSGEHGFKHTKNGHKESGQVRIEIAELLNSVGMKQESSYKVLYRGKTQLRRDFHMTRLLAK